MRAGLTSRQTLCVITLVATIFTAIGIIGDLAGVPEVFMLALCLVTFGAYAWGIMHIWKVITWFHRITGKV
ncbi:hypothetical protein AB4438_08110 [Vibrio breoganii]